jgi:anti-sigma B factor antagonist
MSQEPLKIEDIKGSNDGVRVLRLAGPLILTNVFNFQSMVRADSSRSLIIDFTDVSLADSAGIGALVGAYVSRQKDGRHLGLVGVNRRIHQALEITRVESFFNFYPSIADAERAGSWSESAYKKKSDPPAGPPSLEFLRGLDGLDVLGLPALRTFHDVELDLLTFLQAAESVRLDSGEVYEHIFAVLTANETIALGIVKPLYCSCFHGVAFVPLVLKYALELAG